DYPGRLAGRPRSSLPLGPGGEFGRRSRSGRGGGIERATATRAVRRRTRRPVAAGRRSRELALRVAAATLGLTLGLLLLGAAVEAKSPAPAQDRARTYFMMRLVDALDLPDDKALALRAIFRKADERRVELVAKRQSIDKQLRAALSRPDKNQAELEQLVTQATAVDRDLASVAEDSFRDAQQGLSVEQQAKLVLLRRELQGQVRAAVRRRLGQRSAKPGEHEGGTKSHR